jgi:hypothetical protein
MQKKKIKLLNCDFLRVTTRQTNGIGLQELGPFFHAD